MKIAFVIGALGPGGAETMSVGLACALVKQGAQVDFITVDVPNGSPCERALLERLARSGVRHATLRRVPGSGGLGGGAACLRLRALSRKARYDVIHTHLTLSDTLGAVVRRLGPHSVRQVVTIHHTRERWGTLRRLLIGDVLLVCCAEAVEQTTRFRTSRMRVIPNGVELERFAGGDAVGRATLRQTLGLSDNARIAISVGTLMPLKNYTLALHVLAEARREGDAHLVVCGGARTGAPGVFEAARDALHRIARPLGVDGAVHFLGPRTDVAEWLQASDGFLSCAIAEGMPIAVLEALTSGIPVVLSDIPEHRPLAADMPGTRLCSLDDPQAFGRALATALEGRTDRRAVREQRARFLRPYDMQTCARAYLAAYEEVVSGLKPRAVREASA